MMAFVLAMTVALSPGSPLSGAALEQEARAIDAMLIAPCCFSQQVSVHQSAAAREVKEDVRRRLAAGENRQQILDAYVAQYGKRILAEPPATGFDLTLYIVPFAMLVASIGVISLLIRRVTTRGPAASGADTDIPHAVDERLDDELRDLD